ncbi:MAG: VanW family protein [Dermatophilaceae bacterium]
MSLRDAGAILTRFGVGLVLLGAAYFALSWWVTRAVPATVRIEGVNVGGTSPEEAIARLDRELGPKAKVPVHVDLGNSGQSIVLDPASSGLSLDLPATVEGLAGFSLDPAVVWSHLTGEVQRPVSVVIDRERLTAAVAQKAKTVEVTVKEGSVTFPGGVLTVTNSVTGLALDVPDAVSQISRTWPRQSTLTAAAVLTPPVLSQGAIDSAVRDFATPAMSGPVTVVVGTQTVALSPADIAPSLTMSLDGAGRLVPTVDKAGLAAKIAAATASLVTAPKDATWVLQGDGPALVPAVPGVAVDSAKAADLVVAALTAPDRTARVGTVVAPPSVTTETATGWGVKEVVASFDSAFPYNPSRTANLVAAADTVNGTLVRPGGVFSLNGILGERTADKGYQEGYVIEGGRLVKGTGGGVSQISTVVYNLAWFAGVQLTEHHAHSFYISRYPEGREATVYWPSLDNRWTNNTPYAMLVQMWVADGVVHGRIWSTKVYDIESVKGERTNVRAGKVVTDDSTECVPQPQMTPGFDVTVQRVFRQNGAVVKTESYRTSYDPEDQITCTNPNHKN